MPRIHFEPLNTATFQISGWVWADSEDLSEKGVVVSADAESITTTVSGFRQDVEDIVGTKGLNAFSFPRRDSLWLLRHIDNPGLEYFLDGRKCDDITYTNLDLIQWQSLYLSSDFNILDADEKEQLLEAYRAAENPFQYHYNAVALHVAKKGQDTEFLSRIIDLTCKRSVGASPDFGCRYNELKLLIELGCYSQAIRLFELERLFTRPSDQSQALSDLAFSSLGIGIKDSSLLSRNPSSPVLSDLPQTHQDAIACIYDPIFLTTQFIDNGLDEKRITPPLVYEAIKSGCVTCLNSTFDARSYANCYDCKPEEAAYDLLTDITLLKSPFPGFDCKFVRSYYSLDCASFVHPYLFYLANPSIFISPASYFSSSSSKAGKNTSVWSYERVNGDLFGIYDPQMLKGVQVHANAAPAIHVLVPAFDIKSISAGFFGVFALAKLLSEMQATYKVRLLFFMRFDFNKHLFEYILSQTTGLEDLPRKVDYQFLFPTAASIELNDGMNNDAVFNPLFSPHDKFVATVWFSAYFAQALASKIVQQDGLRPKPFLYLIQDYEVGFHERSSKFVAAQKSYDLDYYALISSKPLYEQLILDETVVGPAAYFHNACAADRSMSGDVERYSSDPSQINRKLLIYGRPEVPRNMFELTALALQNAYKENMFDDSWQFYSAGLGSGSIIQLANDFGFDEVQPLPRLTLKEYQLFVGSCDICLTLMASPHPSLLPFDLAGSGCVVVTNSFQTKTQEYFDDYSQLIICKEPDPSSLCEGIAEALDIVKDPLRRSRMAADFSYPTDWGQTWDSDSVNSLLCSWMEE